jgi:putative DNA primase/helicase
MSTQNNPKAPATKTKPNTLPAPTTGLSPSLLLQHGDDIEIAGDLRGRWDSTCGHLLYAEGSFWCYPLTAASAWVEVPPEDLRHSVHRYSGHSTAKGGTVGLSKGRIDSVLHELGAMCAKPTFFDEAPIGINCRSGFIACDSAGQPSLQPHHPDHRARHVMPGFWQPGTDGKPPADSLLHQLLYAPFRDDDDAQEKVDVLGEVAGSAALGIATRLGQPKAVVLYGRTAGNGKDQHQDAISAALAPAAVSHISPAEFSDDRKLVKLRAALLNTRSELSKASVIAGDTFKAIITGSSVLARDVYRSADDFRPQAQQLYSTNTLPAFSEGLDQGVRRRLLVLVYNRVIPEEERVENIGQRVGKEEPDLLLAWLVDGASRLLRQGAFTVPPSSAQALAGWVAGDIVSEWLEDRVEVRPVEAGQPATKRSAAYADFRTWAVVEGYPERFIPSIKRFTDRVETAQPAISYRRVAAGRFFFGMALRNGARSAVLELLEGTVGAA